MIKITVTPPNQPSFSQEFFTVSDAYDFLMTLHKHGYKGAKEAAQPTEGCSCPVVEGRVYHVVGCSVGFFESLHNADRR